VEATTELRGVSIVDAEGYPLPSSYNPLGTRLRGLFPATELFAAGMRFGGATSDASVHELHNDLDESGTAPRLLGNLADSAWTQAAAHTAVAADGAAA
jgi:hypothetical protein